MPKGFQPTNPPASAAQGFGNVSYVRDEVASALSIWQKISDCIKGEDAVKSRTTQYLPVPDAEAGGKASDARYAGYITRAVFYGVTGRTMKGLVGQVFGRETMINLPANMALLEEDVNGTGVGLEQQAKKTLELTVSLGRAGLLADYPRVNRATSRAEQDSGEIRPIIRMYRPENVINWRTKRIGAKTVLSLVVLVESIDLEDDGFEVQSAVAYRVLRLNAMNEYTVQVYYEDPNNNGKIVAKDENEQVVRDAAGNTFSEIPFTFVGPENNDEHIDPAPLESMAVLNIAHYRNSADYEDSCFITGQPTPYFSGLTEEWVKNVMKDRAYLGSRSAIMLPRNGVAGLLQAKANSMPKEAMEHKEHQMVAIGAKLVEERSIRRTATEARQDEASETSILSSSTKNVTTAYRKVLKWAQMFAGGTGAIEFTLNSDFDLSNMTPQERQQLIAEWQAEAITFSEMRTSLRRSRIAYEDDETARAEIQENPPMTVEEPMNGSGSEDEEDEDDNADT